MTVYRSRFNDALAVANALSSAPLRTPRTHQIYAEACEIMAAFMAQPAEPETSEGTLEAGWQPLLKGVTRTCASAGYSDRSGEPIYRSAESVTGGRFKVGDAVTMRPAWKVVWVCPDGLIRVQLDSADFGLTCDVPAAVLVAAEAP